MAMHRRAGLLLLLLTTSLWAVPEPTADDVEAARRRYERWRRHPDQLARLRQDWQLFQDLPADRREQILQLDHDLHEESSATQARLWNVLDRYVEWLDRLPDADRRAVEEAPDKAARLARIQELRDQEWMRRQAKALRDEWARLDGPARAEFVRKLRQEHRQRRLDWQLAARFWKELDARQPLPARLADFPPGVQDYVKEYLDPLLSPAEKDRLAMADGKWPAYPLTLVELADRHPAALPSPEGPRTVAQLPRDIQTRFLKASKQGMVPKMLKAREGQWPGFAQALIDLNRKRGDNPLPHEFWAYSFKCLLPPMQKFVEETLRPVLTTDEKMDLLHSEGKWPDYPLAIDRMARAHHLAPPWHTLPGPREKWDPYRLGRPTAQGLPELPVAKLREFALYGLDAGERANLNLSPADPDSWQRLTEAYFRHRQGELKRLQQVDHLRARKSTSPVTGSSDPPARSGT